VNGTTLYTPTSSLGRFRADDYFKLPEWTQFELLRGWLVPLNEPTADLTVKSEDAYRATVAVADQWIEGVQSQRCVAGLPAITRRQLVIEVKSPGRRPARMRRLRRYAQLGVEEYWFIDPFERFMLFYVLRAGQYVVHTGIDNRYQSPRLPGVAIDLANFWKEVVERLPAV
jgi:hypothetical protein